MIPSVPWPSWKGEPYLGPIDLTQPSLIDYLDCEEAEALHANIVDILQRHNCQTIVDAGCGDAAILRRYDPTHYMGFDTNRYLISRARRRYPGTHRQFHLCHWDAAPSVEFKTDCLLFIGSLSYNEDHVAGFTRLVDRYKPRVIVIQEILQAQTYIAESNNLNAMPLDHYLQFDHVYHEFDLPVWCGHRVQLEILMLENA